MTPCPGSSVILFTQKWTTLCSRLYYNPILWMRNESPVKILLPFLCLLGLYTWLSAFPRSDPQKKVLEMSVANAPLSGVSAPCPGHLLWGLPVRFGGAQPKGPAEARTTNSIFSYIQMPLIFLYFFFIIQTCLGFLILLAFCCFAKIGLGFAADILR